MDQIAQLRQWIEESERIVFFGGAGVSTESGIPDFRSVDGLYHQEYRYPPEQIISHSFFMQDPEEFYRFYRAKLLYEGIRPNKAHVALAKLEAEGRLSAIVTQNIDGLHQEAGSRKVYELHGSVLRNYCMRCRKFYPMEYMRDSEGIPHCSCGGTVKPDVVLYEEGLDQDVLDGAIRAIRSADLMIVGGTSLVVYPAAGLLNYFRGKHMVLINKTTTQADQMADLVIHESIGTVLERAVR